MAWTAPQTWLPGVVTAGEMNVELRDNLLAQAAAIASGANPNRLLTASAANTIEIRDWKENEVQTGGTAEDTTSTSYTDLATAGPTVTLTTGTKVAVWITAQLTNVTVNAVAWASFAVSGATTSAAADGRAIVHQPAVAGRYLRTTVCTLLDVTAGSNTFTMKYKATSGTCRATRRAIMVVGIN